MGKLIVEIDMFLYLWDLKTERDIPQETLSKKIFTNIRSISIGFTLTLCGRIRPITGTTQEYEDKHSTKQRKE
jgi:hypothetical protein